MGFFQRRQLIVLAAAGVGFLAFLLLRYVPLQKCKAAVKQAKLARQLDVARTQTESEQLPQLRRQLKKLRASAGSFQAKVPSGRCYGLFLERITGLMNRCHLQDQSVQPRREVAISIGTQSQQLINCIPVNIRCSGRLRQIFEFFKLLQQLDREIRIARVELTNRDYLHKDPRLDGSEVNMETEVCIYYTAQ